ncbi:hypothetical protein M758_3G213100 [Ceratodon purpureus]|nr:hypothetical protein M758_3G213100 [Ceratodon purpureus]
MRRNTTCRRNRAFSNLFTSPTKSYCRHRLVHSQKLEANVQTLATIQTTDNNFSSSPQQACTTLQPTCSNQYQDLPIEQVTYTRFYNILESLQMITRITT